eukprot:scaffold2455_cov212-Chaetoceros_neogracile.AAC.12
MNAIARKSAAITARSIRAPTQQQQKRGIVDWMTKYPDKKFQKHDELCALFSSQGISDFLK